MHRVVTPHGLTGECRGVRRKGEGDCRPPPFAYPATVPLSFGTVAYCVEPVC